MVIDVAHLRGAPHFFYKNAKPIIMQKSIYTAVLLCWIGFAQAQIQPQSATVELTNYRNQEQIHQIPIERALSRVRTHLAERGASTSHSLFGGWHGLGRLATSTPGWAF